MERVNVEADEKDEREAEENAPLDLSNLREILGDDTESLREILMLFVDMRETFLKNFSSAIDRRETQELLAGAHQLKGTARNIGAFRLADLALALEHAAGEGDWDKAQLLYRQVEEASLEVKQFIDSF